MRNQNRIYGTEKIARPKKIDQRTAPLVYSSQAHRMLLYAKFKGVKGFVREDWVNFHPSFKLRSHPKECLEKLVKYGLLDFIEKDGMQRFFITSRGEMKLIQMAEAQQEKIKKQLVNNASHFKSAK